MKILSGKKIVLRVIEVGDAEFIVSLRNDKSLNKFISKTSTSVMEQEEWILKYKEREKEEEEYYFIVLDKLTNNKCGTVRLYNLKNKVATWGSFILKSSRPNKASYETICLSLDFAFKVLELEALYLEVDKKNKKAIHVYERTGFKRYKEDSENYFYKMDSEDFYEKV